MNDPIVIGNICYRCGKQHETVFHPVKLENPEQEIMLCTECYAWLLVVTTNGIG